MKKESCGPVTVRVRPLSLKVRTSPFQGEGIGFKSHRGHCAVVQMEYITRSEERRVGERV